MVSWVVVLERTSVELAVVDLEQGASSADVNLQRALAAVDLVLAKGDETLYGR